MNKELKILSLLFSFILLLLSIFACNSQQITVMEIGPYESTSNVDHQAEFSMKFEEFTRLFIVKHKTVTISGKKYTGTYRNSRKGYLYNSDWNFYLCDTGDEFAVNNKTGEVDYVYLTSDFDNNIGDVLSESDCLNIAKEHLSERVDVSDYDLSDLSNSSEYSYTFVFVRFIDGIQTEDAARIVVRKDGKIVHHYYSCLGEMKGFKIPVDEDDSIISELVDNKIKSIYYSISEDRKVSYQPKSELLVRLSNGNYAIQYDYDVSVTSQDDRIVYYTELLSLMVDLG